MEENFHLTGQTRANYYTPGSPVQFVRVELLRGSVSGNRAVCLVFRNISRAVITGLDVMFRCRGESGKILCEDVFEYRDVSAEPGELFGIEDAVYITPEKITSVDVTLRSAYSGSKVVRLENIRRVRLPQPRVLPGSLSAALEERMGRKGLKNAPQMMEMGWYCACGAFHPNEENTAYCSECGCDRVLLQNAVNTLLAASSGEEGSTSEPQQVDEPTRIRQSEDSPAAAAETADPTQDVSATRMRETAQELQEEQDQPMLMSEEEEMDPRDVVAENLIRWIPALTAIICAGIALSGFVYCELFL